MTRKERLELNELSTKAFGGPSKWNKLLQRGTVKVLTRTLEDGTEQKYKGTQWFSLEEVIKTMHEMVALKEKEEAEKLAKQAVTINDSAPVEPVVVEELKIN